MVYIKMIDAGIYSLCRKLLLKIDNNEKFKLLPLKGGRNNKVYKVETYSNEYLFKKYFYHKEDTRNRLVSEYAFLNYAWLKNIRCIPQPFACNYIDRTGLYSFINGRSLNSEDDTGKYIDKAIKFFIDINKHKHLDIANSIPKASEACFSIKDYFYSVEWRINRLVNIENINDLHRDALNFVNSRIIPKWKKIKKRIIVYMKDICLDFDKELEKIKRYISPSDYGFHNTILSYDKKLYFIDFEYAGWDDPLKLICDFFLQPEIPADMQYFYKFFDAVYSNFDDYNFQKKRLDMLFPLEQIKWCCLILNEFLPTAFKRRQFASGDCDYNEEKIPQLTKSKELLNKIDI